MTKLPENISIASSIATMSSVVYEWKMERPRRHEERLRLLKLAHDTVLEFRYHAQLKTTPQFGMADFPSLNIAGHLCI